MPGNPGFEFEIEFVSNFGVRLYNADGTDTPVLLTTLAEDDYSQRAVAITSQCSNPDYFYDFYMPLSVVQTFFPTITEATPLRMVGNTVISTQSALRGPISDINGVNDSAYGSNPDNPWEDLIDGQVPTPLDSAATSGFPPIRSTPPVVSSPIAGGATTVNGTSVEAPGSVIILYMDGDSVGTTTVLGDQSWTLNVTALNVGDVVSATVLAPGKSVSLLSNEVIAGGTCSSPPAITCNSAKGIGGNGPASAPTGTTIRIYRFSAPTIAWQTLATSGTNTWLYNCAGGTTNCTGGGPNCMPASDVYFVTAQEPSRCESGRSTLVCQGTTGTTATAVISTNPINPGLQTITGTSASGASVHLFVNGRYRTTVTAVGTNWSIAGQTYVLGETVEIIAQSGNQCPNATTATRAVTAQTLPPRGV